MEYQTETHCNTQAAPGHNDLESNTRKIFFLDVHQLQSKDQSRLDSIFSTIDQYLIAKNSDRKDHLKHYRDIPIPLEKLYKDSDYVKNRHGHDIQVKIDPYVQNKKKRRQISLIKDSFGQEEEVLFQRLNQAFASLANEFEGRSIFEITEIFMRVSGDLQAVRDYLQGKRVVEWQYLEDIGLSQPETSTEYRCLITTKGREEVEKRKRFLLSTASLNQFRNDNKENEMMDMN
ncbi:UNKNOWN [Stylonychia lemnae]|uniref:Uncharacterized protein n=1 Tax=Stylonychia lemnae TaxID=5949 RepID=A0A078AZF8_STYLE|nr:UNKNOWN [Stylonychia lemnae]|eukprot:CDW86198.1 UNKNOWN [Stylonychia lemnae]